MWWLPSRWIELSSLKTCTFSWKISSMNYSNNRQENLCQLEIIAFHLQVFDDVMFWHKRVRECFSEFDRNDVILLIRDKSLWVNTHRLIIVNWNNRQTEILMFFLRNSTTCSTILQCSTVTTSTFRKPANETITSEALISWIFALITFHKLPFSCVCLCECKLDSFTQLNLISMRGVCYSCHLKYLSFFRNNRDAEHVQLTRARFTDSSREVLRADSLYEKEENETKTQSEIIFTFRSDRQFFSLASFDILSDMIWAFATVEQIRLAVITTINCLHWCFSLGAIHITSNNILCSIRLNNSFSVRNSPGSVR